jgi:hypothetical protein
MIVYFFYVDESGNRDPQTIGHSADGTTKPKDWPYVLLAVGLFEKRWFRFDREIANLKRNWRIHFSIRPRYGLPWPIVKSNHLP